jgi:hypothetical protein
MTASSASVPTLERRREHRVQVHLPMIVRGTARSGGAFEEHTFSENLCRGGAAIITRYPVDLGTQLEIQIKVFPNSASGDTEFSTQGRIVHVKKGSVEREFVAGVEFTGPHFNRIFVSESTS